MKYDFSLNRVARRANTVEMWDTTDNQETYRPTNKFGPNLYKPGDIEYKFNSHGYRCDELYLHSDIPIVFLGCSYTEGIGLPYQETWSYRLLTKIREKTGKNIPYWNLGLCAAGVDTMASSLYWFNKQFSHKLKYVFMLMPPFSRREYAFNSKDTMLWMFPDPTLYQEEVDRLFVDIDFGHHQLYRSLMIMDGIKQQFPVKMLYSAWGDLSFLQDTLKHEPYKIPEIPFENIVFPHEHHRVDLARDNCHPGPRLHTALADKFWDAIKSDF